MRTMNIGFVRIAHATFVGMILGFGPPVLLLNSAALRVFHHNGVILPPSPRGRNCFIRK
jgi:hypothetical protein